MRYNSTPTAWKFKLSLIGVCVSLVLVLLGIVSPFNDMLIRFPLTWAVGLLILLPSITVYYDVKEKFWAEIAKK